MDTYYDNAYIDCKVKKDNSIFITAEGLALLVAGQQDVCINGGIKIQSRTNMGFYINKSLR